MSAYVREASAWTGGPLRARTASEWTGEGDAGYVWDGAEWVKFQPNPSSELPAPENLSGIAGATDAVLSWTNPEAATTAGATDIQYRVPESGGGAWTELPYPTTTVTLGWLSPETTYQFQIRYIIRSTEDGSVTDIGPIAEVFFTTLALSGPGTPAPDPGGSGPDSIVTWPSTVGTPGAVGSSDCWWEYIVQIVDSPVEGAVSWSDTAVTDEIAGNIGDLAIDFVAEGLTCNGMARWKYREVCDSVPGDWQYSGAFLIPCDWDTACGGNQNDSKSLAPYSDANLISLVPHVCPIDGGGSEPDDPTRIVDDVTDQVFSKDAGFFGVSRYQNNDVVVARSDASDFGSPIISGYNSNLADITASSDVTFSGWFMLDSQPQTIAGTKLVTIGRTFRIQAYAEGSGFTISAVFPKVGGGAFNMNGTTELPLDEWHTWTVTIDADGNKILYINAEVEVTDTDTSNPDFDGTGLTSEIILFGSAWTRQLLVATWDRVLAPDEIPSGFHTSPWVAGVEGSLSDTVDFPTGITGTNEILYITALRDYTLSGSESFVTPAGWTKIGTAQNGAAWYKVATGSETGSVTVTGSTQTEMFLVRNIDTDYPLGLFGEHFVGQFNSTNVDSAQLNLAIQNFPIENSSIMSLGSMTAASTTDFTGQVVGGSNHIPPADIQSLAQLNSTALAFGVWSENYENVQGNWDATNSPNTLYSSNPTNDGNTGGYSVQLVFCPHAPGRDTDVPKIVGVTFDQRTSSTPVHTVPQGTSDGDLIVVMAPLCNGATAVDANMTLAVAAGSIDAHVAYTTYASAHGTTYSPSGTFVTSVSRYSMCIRIIDADGTLIDAQTGTSVYGANSQYPLNTSDLTLTPTGAGQIALFNGHCRSRTDGQEFNDANGWTGVKWTGGFVSGGSDGTGMVSYKDVGASGAITVPTHSWITTPADPHYPFAFHGAVFS